MRQRHGSGGFYQFPGQRGAGFGFLATPPCQVTGYRAWLGVNEDSELADFFNGLAQGLGET